MSSLRREILDVLEREPEATRHLALARLYVSWGWHVFPLAAGSKVPPSKKDLGLPEDADAGLLLATTDETQITEWWGRHPRWNIGLNCGASGLAVVDPDLYKPGVPERFAELSARLGMLETFTVRTPKDGRHYYTAQNGVPVGSGEIAVGIDCKGIGGYVVGPGSIVDGKYYLPESDFEIETIPDAWAAFLPRPPAQARAEPAPTGRNPRLLRMTWRDRANGLPEEDVLRRALDSADGRSLVAEGRQAEIERMVRNAFAKDPNVFHLTDLGNARRFVHEHASVVLYSHTSRAWLVWSGRHWQRDADATVDRLAKDTVLGLYAQAATSTNEDQRKRIAAHATKSERADRIAAMLRLAQSETEIATTDDRLDRDGWLLNVENGTLDLRTLTLRPHDPADLLTHLIEIPYTPEASAPRWLAFLSRVLDMDDELHSFVQRAVGYSLTGDTTEQVFFLLHGDGKNGKTTFVETIRELPGPLSRAARFESFLAKRDSGGVPTDIARLHRARLVTSTEAQEGRRLDEATVKELTGGETIVARFLYQREFEFRPTFKLWLSSNYRPTIRGTDLAIWRRVRLIPFAVTIPEPERDADLGKKLITELPGILAWAVEGLRQWHAQRLGTCPKVEAHTREYQSEQDTIGRWITENCAFTPTAEISKADLYAAYSKALKDLGEHPVPGTTFSRRLVRLHPEIRERKSMSTRFWVGVALR